MSGDAHFYDNRRRRLWLSREWGDRLNSVLLIGLNPSFADEEKPDHTITVEIEFATRWGFGALLKGNLFTLISKDPAQLAIVQDAEGDPQNLRWLEETAARARTIVLCWGDDGQVRSRASYVRGALWDQRKKMFCLGRTKKGEPRHTSRLAYDTPLQPIWLGQ